MNRPGITVRTRNGYFEPAASARGKAVAHPATVEEALAGILPKADLQIQVSAAPFAVPGDDRAAIAIVLGVRQGTPNQATRLANRIDLRVAAFTPDGGTRATRRETVEVTLNKPGFGTMVGYEVMSRLRLARQRQPSRRELGYVHLARHHALRHERCVCAHRTRFQWDGEAAAPMARAAQIEAATRSKAIKK